MFSVKRPEIVGKWSNLIHIFFNWVGSTISNELVRKNKAVKVNFDQFQTKSHVGLLYTQSDRGLSSSSKVFRLTIGDAGDRREGSFFENSLNGSKLRLQNSAPWKMIFLSEDGIRQIAWYLLSWCFQKVLGSRSVSVCHAESYPNSHKEELFRPKWWCCYLFLFVVCLSRTTLLFEEHCNTIITVSSVAIFKFLEHYFLLHQFGDLAVKVRHL